MRVAFRLPFVQTCVLNRLSVVLLGLFLPFAGVGVQAQTTYTGTVDFGTVDVGSSSGSQTLTFNFTSPTALNVSTPVRVLTTGVANLDFKSDGTGSCGGATYSSCTVGVIFSPTAPGLRLGAVVIEDTSGNVLATAYIHGAGHGPQAVFDPGLQSTIGTATGVNGLAADGAGNVYIADAATPPSIYKVAPGGTQTTVTQLSSGPDGVAVDGAGNVYVAVPINSTIVKITPAGVTTQVGTGLGFAGGLAVDGLGNLYVTLASLPGGVVKVAPNGTQTAVGTGLAQPAGVAVDASGNIFIANTGGGTIVKIAPDSTQTTLVSGLSYPGAITVDPSGNLYVALQLAGQVVEYSPTGTRLRTFGHGLSNPSAVALDALGNLYVNSGATQKFDRTPPTVGFLTSSVGVISTDSPKAVTLEDIGNDTLTFPVPASGTNPTISSSFSLDGGTTTCPQLTSASGAAGTLAMGTSCVYSVDFTPTTTGTITGSLVVTDNSLNVANGTQSVTLNNQGTVVIVPATVTVGFVDVNYTGAPVPVPITTVPAGLAVSVTYTSLTLGTTSTTDPSAPDFYMVTATVTTPGYSGSGSNYLIINSLPNPTITWATPAPITLGTPLSATQLNATANTPGTFTYSIPSGTVLAVGSYPITVNFVATDTADFSPNASATVTLVVQQNTQPVTPVNFGTLLVGSTAPAQTVTFTFVNPVTLGSTPVQVLTQGIAGLDFANTNAGSCAAGAYAVSAACTVTVNFTPAVPGPRLGSVTLLDASGNAVGTALIGGVGQGPQIAYDPGVKSIVAPSLATYGLAIDAAGDLYLNTLTSIVKVTPSGVQTTVASVSGGVSGATAIDGAGNIYTLNLANSMVYEITPSGAQYQVGSGWVFPTDLAVDTAGNLYVTDRGYNPPPDTTGGRLTKISAAGIQTTMAGPFVSPDGVAVDGAGNVYVTDNAGLGIINPGLIGVVYKVTPGGTLSTVASGLFSPNGVAVDAAGNLFVTTASSNTSIDRITQAGVRTTLYDGQVSFPETVKIAPSGDLYITQSVTGAQLLKIDRSTVPSFTFESTTVGSVSADSPQAFTLENIGNATLNFSAPGTGTNASISANYFLAHATTCPQSSAASTLASGATCVYSIEFLPSTSGTILGSLTLTDNALGVANAMQAIPLTGAGVAGTVAATVTLSNLNQTYTGSPISVTATTNPVGLAVSITYNGGSTPPTAAGTYAVVATITAQGYTGSMTGNLVIAQATPVIAWANPADITYGTALSATQLNATASVAGTFAYTPAIGATLNAGTDTLGVVFTPTDAVDYTTASASVSIVVSQATPVITWANPAGITYGTTLSATQLNATASVAGTFAYTPAAGTTPTAGTDSLSVTFTPTDATNYTSATKSASIVVSQATPVITWANPAAITYGTALSATQLNATASVPGTFAYTPAPGTVPLAGTDTLSVTFTPTDTTDYTTATASVSITVTPATPVITWANPAAITYGTQLSATQLNATASVAGTLAYTPGVGTTPLAGTDTLSVTFTPTDTTDYTTATASVSITVTAATPVITWANPAAITYGTQLGATQLNATASVAGTFVYTPAAGTTPSAGTDTLSVTFTPTDATDYTTATATVSLVVNQATPVVTWATPAGIGYGTALSATQLNATASVPGTFTYTPAAGTIPPAGTDTLSVTFTPTDATDYATVTETVQLAVSQATPVITWANPAAITYGTALSATQLNATAAVAGTFAYAPAAGTIPAAGTDTLSVTFTPTDSTDYTSATKSVSIVVSQATPVITWANPAAISYGTALTATQLNATASVAGTFVYSPAAGAIPLAGTDTLSVTFTPTDALDYTAATKSVSIVVTPPAPVITWANPAAITYGTPLSATQLNATASVAGTFAYNPAAGTVLLAGSNTLGVTFTPTDTTDYTTATKSVTIVVNPATLTVSAANGTRVYGAANPAFTGSVSGNQNGDTFAETFSTTATTLSNVGTYAIVPAVTGSNLTSYTQTVVNGTLTVTQAGSTTTLGVSSTTPALGQSVTLTAQVASATSGTPTGSVQFMDGTTVLNTATLSAGTATFATSALALGAHSITAVYLGDTNFTGYNSGAAQVVTVSGSLDFTISAITQTQTVIPGAIVSYSFNVAPVNGTYPSSVSFAASGLPPGATATFSPSSIAATGGAQTVTVAIQTSTAIIANNSSNSLPPIALALLLLPLAGTKRFRKSGKRMTRMACMLLLLGGGALATAALSGCGTNNGFFGQSQKAYNVTITATSGTVSHTATVTLDLE
ncbi:MAG TPA: MBG domain-containing protein [Acidobacteriaceae bacterium]|nr:MBG domain-containing protein [Acidobacteriaceae bacterium]